MVAAEQDPFLREALTVGNSANHGDEVRRLHAGIAAILVDLVRGRFDERELVPATGGAEQGA